jgi:hypothetical protein
MEATETSQKRNNFIVKIIIWKRRFSYVSCEEQHTLREYMYVPEPRRVK